MVTDPAEHDSLTTLTIRAAKELGFGSGQLRFILSVDETVAAELLARECQLLPRSLVTHRALQASARLRA